jgi:hypothetical protein
VGVTPGESDGAVERKRREHIARDDDNSAPASYAGAGSDIGDVGAHDQCGGSDAAGVGSHPLQLCMCLECASSPSQMNPFCGERSPRLIF